jgi:hypothetical protein
VHPHSSPLSGTSGLRGTTLAAAGSVAAFVAYGLLRLPSLEYNFDEGVYIAQARLVMASLRPYVDFFYHQTPLYLYTLAGFAAVAPDSLVPYRMLSLLATAATGLFVYAMARRLLAPVPAVFALILFYTAPLQFYDMLALPNGVMLCLATAGTWFLGFRRGAANAAVGAALLVLAILEKPIALPLAAAVGIATIVDRSRWQDALWAAVVGTSTGLSAWLLFDRMSGGGFTELLRIQTGRIASKSGFEIMLGYAPFQQRVRVLGLHSGLGWNLYEHARSLLLPGPFGNLHLVLLAALGQIHVLRRPAPAWVGRRLLITALWVLPFLFSVFVFEPVWDHYFVQYLPALALLGGAALQVLWETPRLPWLARGAGITVLLLGVAAGVLHVELRTADYTLVPHVQSPGERWLTFDPFLAFVAGAEPACGLIDPFNVYGEHSLVALSDTAPWQRFRIDSEDLLRCLQTDPSIRVAIRSVQRFFVDRDFQQDLERLGPQRMVHIPLVLNNQKRQLQWSSLLRWRSLLR